MYRSQVIYQIDMKAELRSNTTSIALSNSSSTLFNSHQNPLSGALKGCLGTLDGACIEKLLLHCANALENSDINSAQQVMWVLNNVASSSGDPNQRLASWFLRALISRSSRVCPTAMNLNGGRSAFQFQRRLMSVTELAGYVDLIPWHRFGFCASNSAIFKAIQGCPKVHILDFSITHCMQWPTLIDALAKRSEGPPSLRISVPSWRPSVPPFLNVLAEQVGLRLTNFANFRNVPFEFKVIEVPPSIQESSFNFNYEFLLTQTNLFQDDEALVINCQNWLRYMPDHIKDSFLEIIKSLNPHILTIVDEDSDLGSTSLASRITTCFNFLWIPFDALETFLPKDSCQRMEYEADIGHKIYNIIGSEGRQRIERLESGAKFSQRMKNLGFYTVPFGEDTISEVKFLLDEHASGWGMKFEDDMIVLTWKGHNSVYATAWYPYGFQD